MKKEELSQIDYKYWCKACKGTDVKVYKNQISYYKNGVEYITSKKDLGISPINMMVNVIHNQNKEENATQI